MGGLPLTDAGPLYPHALWHLLTAMLCESRGGATLCVVRGTPTSRGEPQGQGAQNDRRAEYNLDYSTTVRGKYYHCLLREGANVVVLEPDVAKAFRSSTAVNEALRSLITAARSMSQRPATSVRPPRKRRAIAASQAHTGRSAPSILPPGRSRFRCGGSGLE
jgi:hypothetical protein